MLNKQMMGMIQKHNPNIIRIKYYSNPKAIAIKFMDMSEVVLIDNEVNLTMVKFYPEKQYALDIQKELTDFVLHYIKKKYVNIIDRKNTVVVPIFLLRELRKKINRVLIDSEFFVDYEYKIHVYSDGAPVTQVKKNTVIIKELNNPAVDTDVAIYENSKTIVILEKAKHEFDVIKYVSDMKNNTLIEQKTEYRTVEDFYEAMKILENI